MIGTPDIADALIDPQRPERMLRYADFDTQPIDGQSSYIPIPIEEPKAKTCKIIDKYASAGLDYGMKALGLPPKLPTTADLADQASDYLVTTAMTTLPEGSRPRPPSSAKEKATRWLLYCVSSASLIEHPNVSEGYHSAART